MDNGDNLKSPKPARAKRALVLPGGGGRGAYQVGVAKALSEQGIEFDLAFGTSIGAINATFLAQGELQRLEKVWQRIKSTDIFRFPSATQVGNMIFGTKLGLLDNSPLESLLRKEINFQKLKQSSIKVGLFTTDLCSLETKLITMDDIASFNELIDMLMATSAVPLAFPPRQLHGKGLWVDGGLVKNTPLQAAIDFGATEIFMVLLHPETIDACPSNMFQVFSRLLDVVLDASARKEIQTAHLYNNLIEQGSSEARGRHKVNVHVIQPHKPVNTNLLEVDPEQSRKLMQMGYEDAMTQLVDYFQHADKSAKTIATSPS